MVIIVDAGAVAAANAQRMIENGSVKFRIQNASTKTKSDAINDSNTVMTTSRSPLLRIKCSLKNSPDEKAMNASAISEMNSVPLMMLDGTTSAQQGPSTTPVRMYAVTLGSLNSFVTRVARKPQNSMMATDMMTTDTGDIPLKSVRMLANMFDVIGEVI